tara:strand:+ start:170 stop:1876 length:1707 start_codon:yes stop_codon:yes gene_type:complete
MVRFVFYLLVFFCTKLQAQDSCLPINFSYENTGANMTLFIPAEVVQSNAIMNAGDSIGVFISNEYSELICVGSAEWLNNPIQISAWGDDEYTDQIDGYIDGQELVWIAQTSNGVYNLSVNYYSNTDTLFGINGLSYIASFDFEYLCDGLGEIGCMDATAFNYNSNAIVDDSSCMPFIDGCMDAHYLEYNIDANTNNDMDCITAYIYGCTNDFYEEYDSQATLDDGSCLVLSCDVWEYEMIDCSSLSSSLCNSVDGCTWQTTGGGGGGYGRSFCTGGIVETNGLCIIYGCTDELAENFQPLATSNDGSCDYGQLGELSFYNLDLSDQTIEIHLNCEYAVSSFEFSVLGISLDSLYGGASNIAEFEINIEEENTITGVASSDEYIPEDAGHLLTIHFANYEYEICFSESHITTYIGIEYEAVLGSCIIIGCQNELAVNYDENVTFDNDSCIFGVEIVSEYQSNLDSLVGELNILQLELDSCLSSQSSFEPIYINLDEGWNMIGFTHITPQDLTATFESINNQILLVKNNAGEVYWQEFNFNGIGNLIPGQGYQIKLSQTIENYIFPTINE